MGELWHAKNKDQQGSTSSSSSKYSGGFTTVRGRLNNTKAYNHDYYLKNKSKWLRYARKDKKPKPKYNKIQDWLGADERDEYNDSWKRVEDAEYYNDQLRSYDPNNGFYNRKFDYMDWNGFDKERARREGIVKLAEDEYNAAYSRYSKTPLGKIENAIDEADYQLWKLGKSVGKPFKAIGKALSAAYDEVDYQLWKAGKKLKGEW